MHFGNQELLLVEVSLNIIGASSYPDKVFVDGVGVIRVLGLEVISQVSFITIGIGDLDRVGASDGPCLFVILKSIGHGSPSGSAAISRLDYRHLFDAPAEWSSRDRLVVPLVDSSTKTDVIQSIALEDI
jgi:hypothetical protein